MPGWVDVQKCDAHVARERKRARDLRNTAWWRNQCAAGRCHYCGRMTAPDTLTMDHIVPVARGGLSRRGNVVPCCLECNREKGCLTPVERLLDEMDTR